MAMRTNIVAVSEPGALRRAAEIIRKGGVVAFPTETVYGLGADALNALAVARIFEIKGRPRIDPLIVHLADSHEAERYAYLPEFWFHSLVARFWPGPLTLVVRKKPVVPPIVTAGLETVALRVPAHEVARELIRAAGTAIAAPSANLFGRVSPTEAAHVAEQLEDRVDLILDGARCRVGIESTIISLVEQRPRILRAGGTTIEHIEEVVGRVERFPVRSATPDSPGQLPRHYATRTPLQIVSGASADAEPRVNERVGLLTLNSHPQSERYAAVEILSSSGNLREAAANLFAALHRLDKLKLDRLIAFPVTEEGLGIAIMDRLRRCAAGSRVPDN